MKLGEFIKEFSHNNIVRLVYDYKGGHKLVGEDWNDVSMDHEITRQTGKFKNYINNEVLGLATILVKGHYPEALNICIERLENQPQLEDLYEKKNKNSDGQ